jgi:hypothetical protein
MQLKATLETPCLSNELHTLNIMPYNIRTVVNVVSERLVNVNVKIYFEDIKHKLYETS